MLSKYRAETTTWSKKWSYYCMNYDCANCPKRDGYMCTNEEWIK